jgi:hypothetical protein
MLRKGSDGFIKIFYISEMRFNNSHRGGLFLYVMVK